MGRNLIIRKAITSQISKVTNSVFYEHAGGNASYPHVVFLINGSFNDGALEQVDLEVDFWDIPANGSTVALDRLTDEVDAKLHRFTYREDGVFFRVLRENRRAITDTSDEKIRRRQMIYQIRMMGVGM